jgi:hypothetical protein
VNTAQSAVWNDPKFQRLLKVVLSMKKKPKPKRSLGFSRKNKFVKKKCR